MTRFRPLLAAAIVALAAACVVTPPGGGGAGFHPGERVYRARCTSCHAEIDRAEHSAGEWERLVSRYGRVANLGDHDRRVILAYLTGEAPARPASPDRR